MKHTQDRHSNGVLGIDHDIVGLDDHLACAINAPDAVELPILTMVGRGGAKRTQRIADRANATIQKALAPVIPADAVLCSDALRAYGNFARSKGLEHFAVGGAKGKAQAAASHHIQNINSLHSKY